MSEFMPAIIPDKDQLPDKDGPNVHLPAAWNPLADAGVSVTNLPLDDPDGQRLQLLALNGEHPKVKVSANVVFDLYAYLIHPYDHEDEDTGEIEGRCRLVLIGHDGSMFQGGGKYTLESLARLIRSCGGGPWHPPIKLQIVAQETAKSRTIYKLVPVQPESQRMPWEARPQEGKKRAK